MVNLLRRIFIKDYQNVMDEKVRNDHGRLAGFFGVFSNLLLFAVKLFVGLLSASLSIIADSINNLADMGSSIVTLIGFKLAASPADEEHPYGHQRMEYIAGLIVAITIIFVGGSLLMSSLEKIIGFEPVFIDRKITYLAIGILSVSILIKFLQGMFNRKMGKLINSIALEATSKDSLNDCISTACILIGNVVLLFFPDLPFSLDGALGVLVSLFIVVSGIKLVMEAVDPLIGVSADTDVVKDIIKVIKEEPYVLGYHDLVCHMYGPTKCFMTIHLEVDCNLKMLDVHDDIDNLERKVFNEFGVALTVHIDPIQIDDEEVNELRKRVKAVVKGIDENLSIHDFRVVSGATHTNLIFDVVKPFKFKYTESQILKMIQEQFKNQETEYYFVVEFDNAYVKKDVMNEEF